MGYISKITDTNGTTHLVASTLYGTCSTAAGTAEKAVTCASFDTAMTNVPTGLTIMVKFTNSNTAATPKLNINSKGAKNIYAYGTTKPGTTTQTTWNNGAIVSFTYDGSAWLMNDYKVSDINHNTNTWRNIKVNGTEQLGTGTGTDALNFINGTNTTVTYDSGIKISATDSKVEQNETSSTNLYPILFSSRQIDDSSTGAYVANRNSQIYVKPGDGVLRAYHLSSNQMSCNVFHLTTTHEDQTISSMITQPFVSGVNLQHDLPCTSGILLNDTDFNEIHEVIFDDTNSGTTATNPIDFDITDEIDRIKYIDILYTDTNYQKTVNGYNIEQKSENFGFLRIPFDKVRYTYSISANVPSTLFSLSLIGDKNSYYIRKQTYALSIVQSGSQQTDPTYTLDIREFNSGLVIQFYGAPGTGTYGNMTTRAQYTNAIRILKVVLIKELKEQQ